MKKILASLAAVAALTGFAGSAFAAGENVSTGGSSTAASYNSVHSGSVTATCSLAVTDGTLPTGAGLVNSLASNANGVISTVCNSTGSKLDVAIDTTAPAAGNTLASGISGYEESFKLSGGTGAYSGVTTTSFVPSLSGAFKTDLTNGYSATASTVNVDAQVKVGSAFILPAGAYTVKVQATVTP